MCTVRCSGRLGEGGVCLGGVTPPVDRILDTRLLLRRVKIFIRGCLYYQKSEFISLTAILANPEEHKGKTYTLVNISISGR